MALAQTLHRAALVSLVGGAGGAAWLKLKLRPKRSIAPPVEPGRHRVSLIDTRRVVPSVGLPAEIALGNSNNNLDVVRHADGWVYLAFRTAPHHFANPHTTIYVVRSRDEVAWELEARFFLGTDLREPRLLTLGDRLLLYVSRLGHDVFSFRPQGVSLAERAADGKWSQLAPVGPPGLIAWRARHLGSTPVLLTYSGGETIYDFGTPRLRVGLWKVGDGRNWEPYDAGRPYVYQGGGSEADCVVGDDGTLYGVIRNEAGDGSGWGSKVCRAAAEDPTHWQCLSDRRKYDSPCMFWYDGEAYLIARRNLNGNGAYDLGQGGGHVQRTLWNQVNYSLTPKRTALWRYVQGEDRFAFLLDLPSRGDCCFPAVIPRERGEHVVYDYSSALDGPDLPWLMGQRGSTYIYRHVLRFERSASL